jgi:hypothetical protein
VEAQQHDHRPDAFAAGTDEMRGDLGEAGLARAELGGEALLHAREIVPDRRG